MKLSIVAGGKDSAEHREHLAEMAPELLEALESVMHLMEALGGASAPFRELIKTSDAGRMAERTIAKARGSTSLGGAAERFLRGGK